MPERVNRAPFRQQLESKAKSGVTETHTRDDLRNEVKTMFGEPLKTAEDALEDTFADKIIATATTEGLTKADLKAAWKEVHRHVSIEANFDARNKLEADRKAAGFNPLKRAAVALREAGEVFGFGLANEVVDKQKEIVAKKDNMQALLESAVESQVMKRRLEQYYELGKPDLKTAIDKFITGQATYNQLLEDPAYLSGLKKITDQIVIGDTFTIEMPNPDPDNTTPVTQEIDTTDEHVKKAIRKHLQFVLRTEVVQLAQAKQLEVLSSDEHKAEAPTTFLAKTGAVAKGVFGSGTVWGAGTRTVTRLAMGGVFGAAIVSGGWVGVAVGAGIGMTAGALAGAARETINAKHREKKQRLDAALGAISNEVVKSATGIDKELTTKTAALQAILETGTADQKKAAVVELYKTVADTQARLLRSRVGDPVLNDDASVNVEATTALDASKKAKRQKQDYISFGVQNRFQAQLQLLDNLEKSLAAIELVLDQDEALAQSCRQAMVAVNTETDKALREAQHNLENKIAAENKQYVRRAFIVGGLAGGISAAAVDGLSTAWNAVGAHGFHIPFISSAEAAEPSHVIDQASSHFAGPTELSASQPVPISFQGEDYVMSVDAQGIAHLDHITDAGAHVQVGEAFPLMSTETGNPHFFIDNSGDHVTVYDASTHQQLASFDGTHGVVTSAAEAAPGGSVDSIFADAKVKTILDKMGVQQGEVQYDPNTHLFHIPDDAVKGEYLGQTAGWRARRLEFILKAMQENKSEPADMIVARAERATRHLLLEGKKYPDANAAYVEAFGKSSSFITHNEIPWVDGPSSHVGKQWMHLIDQLKQAHVNVDQAGSAAHVAGTPSVPGADHVATSITAASGSAHEAAGSIGAIAEKITADFSKNFGEQLAIDMSLRGMGETMVGMGLAGVVEFAYAKPVLERTPENEREFTTTDSDEFHVKETTLPDVQETATKVKTAELAEATRKEGPHICSEMNTFITSANADITLSNTNLEAIQVALAAGKVTSTEVDITTAIGPIETKLTEARNLLAKEKDGVKYNDIDTASNGDKLHKWIAAQEEVVQKAELMKTKVKENIMNDFIATTDAAILPKFTALETVRTDILGSSLTAAHIDAVVAAVPAFAEIQAKLTEGRALLAKEDAGVKYSDVDTTNNGDKLHKWIAAQEEVLKLGDLIKTKVEENINGLATAVTTARQDTNLTPAKRRSELEGLVTNLKLVDDLPKLVPSVISDTAWQTTIETQRNKIQTEAEGAIAMVVLEQYLSNNKDVKAAVMTRLETEGCFDPADPTLPKADKADLIVKFTTKMSGYKVGKTGLEEMGFMTTTGMKLFKTEHAARVTVVLDRLFNGDDDIFAK